jgi:hypothetical protein
LETIDELESILIEATAPGYRGQLVARGLSRAMIWRNGELPEGSPSYAPFLSADLLDYGFSLLRMGLTLRELSGSQVIMRKAFETAAESIEAVIRNGPATLPERGFFRVCAASAYHLAGYSARAYSLTAGSIGTSNLSPCENALAFLILRTLDDLQTYALGWLEVPRNADEGLRGLVADEGSGMNVEEAFQIALNGHFLRAILKF